MLSIKILNVTKVQGAIKNQVQTGKLEKKLDEAAHLVELEAKHRVRRDTSRLMTSIDVIKRPLTRYIGSSVVYARAQECGRADLPRYGYTPYLRPAIRNNKAEIKRLIKEGLGTA